MIIAAKKFSAYVYTSVVCTDVIIIM